MLKKVWEKGVGFGAGEKDLSSKGLFHRPNSLHLFFTNLCRELRQKQRLRQHKIAAAFFIQNTASLYEQILPLFVREE